MVACRRTWRTLWIDRRKFPQCVAGVSLLLVFLAWALVSTTVAQSLPAEHGSPINTNDLIQWQWWAIVGLLSIVGLLISFIFLYLWNSTKTDVRDLWEKKLGKEEHENTDHSRLCPACRDAHFVATKR